MLVSYITRKGVISILLCLAIALPVRAELVKLKESMVEDSENEYADRIYYYDMALDAQGGAHLLYARPNQERTGSTVVLANESATGWQKRNLTSMGIYRSDAIQILADSKNNFHLTFIEKNGKIDIFGNPDADLVYLKLTASELQTLGIDAINARKQKVSLGGWRSRMQVGPNDSVYIVREFEDGFCMMVPDATNTTAQKNTACSIVYKGWQARKLDLPAINWSRLGGFHIDRLGGAHLIYGDYAYDSNGAAHAGRDEFGYHNLWYAHANSPGDNTWQASILDEDEQDPLPTLYNQEFWVDLTTDEAGKPAVTKWLWKPGTEAYKAYGTKAVLFYNTGNRWVRQITRSFDASLTYVPKDTVEGMGTGLRKDQYGWHGVWDNSHPRPFEHDSPRGGLIYRYSPDGDNWSAYQVLAPYSGEGHSVVRVQNNMLNVLILGDYTDAKLYFLRYRLPGNDVMEVFPDRRFYYMGEPVTLHAQVRSQAVGDFYVVALSRPRPEISQPQEIWLLTGDLTWQKISSLDELRPLLRLGVGLQFHQPLAMIAPMQPPFDKRDTWYDIYSVVAQPGSNVLDGQWVTPLVRHSLLTNLALP